MTDSSPYALAPVSVAPGATALKSQMSIGNRRMDSNKPVTINGREFLQNIVNFAGSIVGSTLLNQNIAPQYLPNGRLTVLSTLFEKYRIKYCRALYTPQVATSQGGQFFMYFDYDPTEDLETGEAAIYKASNSSSSVDNVFWKPCTLNMSQKLRQTSYYTSQGNDDRNEVQSVLNIVTNTPNPTETDMVLGSVVIEYSIEFYGGELQPDVGSNVSFLTTLIEGPLYLNVSSNTTPDTIAGNITNGTYPVISGVNYSPTFQVSGVNTTQYIWLEKGVYWYESYMQLYAYSSTSATPSFNFGPSPAADYEVLTAVYSNGPGDVEVAHTAIATLNVVREGWIRQTWVFNTTTNPITNISCRVNKLANTLADYERFFDPTFGPFRKTGVRSFKTIEAQIQNLAKKLELLNTNRGSLPALTTPFKETERVKPCYF